MQTAHRSPLPVRLVAPVTLPALGSAGLTDGVATVVVRPVRTAAERDRLVARIGEVRGVGVAYAARHDGEVLTIGVTTTRPVALAGELRVAVRREVRSLTATAGRFDVQLAGRPAAPGTASRPRFDHRVASAADHALGLDRYPTAPAAASRGRRAPAPSVPGSVAVGDVQVLTATACDVAPRRGAGLAVSSRPAPRRPAALPAPRRCALAGPAVGARPALPAGR